MFDDLPREDVLTAIDVAVGELLDAAGVREPPVDALQLAQRHLGMIVTLDKRQAQRGRAQRSGAVRQIVLRPEPTEERHQWTVAHEIGEHLKSQLLKRIGLEPEQTRAMAGESLANLFAFRLLVPTAWLGNDAPGCAYDVLQLKERYRTASHEVVAWRLLDLPAPCIITIVDNERVQGRRSNSWRVNRQLSPAEQACLRHVNRHGQPYLLCQKGWTVQGWPVHKPDWKREILRSVVEIEE